jgi:hypothetical protein
MSIESQANLTAAEQAAIPLISRAGLNLLHMHGLRVVAAQDIGAIQAAYTRITERTAVVVTQIAGIAQEYVLLRLAQERDARSDAWIDADDQTAMLALPCGWRIETRTTPDGVTAALAHDMTIQAEADGLDIPTALAAMHLRFYERLQP